MQTFTLFQYILSGIVGAMLCIRHLSLRTKIGYWFTFQLTEILVFLSRMTEFSDLGPGIFLVGLPEGVHYLLWVLGRVIGKGIDFPDISIRNGFDLHNCGIRNGNNFSRFLI